MLFILYILIVLSSLIGADGDFLDTVKDLKKDASTGDLKILKELHFLKKKQYKDMDKKLQNIIKNSDYLDSLKEANYESIGQLLKDFVKLQIELEREQFKEFLFNQEEKDQKKFLKEEINMHELLLKDLKDSNKKNEPIWKKEIEELKQKQNSLKKAIEEDELTLLKLKNDLDITRFEIENSSLNYINNRLQKNHNIEDSSIFKEKISELKIQIDHENNIFEKESRFFKEELKRLQKILKQVEKDM